MARVFDGYTIAPAKGVWKGKSERSLMIHIIGSGIEREVLEVANKIKQMNRQQAVLVERLPNKTVMV